MSCLPESVSDRMWLKESMIKFNNALSDLYSDILFKIEYKPWPTMSRKDLLKIVDLLELKASCSGHDLLDRKDRFKIEKKLKKIRKKINKKDYDNDLIKLLDKTRLISKRYV